MDLWSNAEGDKAVGLDVAGKWSSLLSHNTDDPTLFAKRDSITEFFRLRLGFNGYYEDWLNWELAYEQRARWLSQGAGTGGGVLPCEADAPFRIRQLDWQAINDGERFIWRHEIDRALVSFHRQWGEVTLGRQAIGLGRGRLFSAVDIFSPFSPLEIDREWRQGVDAARVEYQLSDTSSAEVIAAIGETWEKSALIARLRGYFDEIDAEFIFGKRAEDLMVAGVVSAAVMEAEVHCELALYNTPEAQTDGGIFNNDHEVAKAVFGGSYTFDVGNGLTFLTEYHYSGFGLKDVGRVTDKLDEPTFAERIIRGDTQTLGREALAYQLSYPFSISLNGAFLVLHSPQDGSAVLSPSLIWDFSKSASLLGSIFIPCGDQPSGGKIKSEYGSTPLSFFLQLRMYY
ncbi:MAG: hypothetical protein DRP65_06505 [Planctomycetota bacterium]|nr:MAG: hypothetical protein DRP65_06505 [Planctomycetota bacterium]